MDGGRSRKELALGVSDKPSGWINKQGVLRIMFKFRYKDGLVVGIG